MTSGRLVALVPAGGLSGVQRTHVEMAVALRDRGWDVHTLIPGRPEGLDGELDRHELPHHGIPPLAWAARSPRGPEQVDPSLVDLRLCDLLSDLRPDAVLTQSAVAPQLAVAARELQIPHAWYVHEFCNSDHDLILPMSAVDWGAFMQRHSSAIMCNSQAVRRHFFAGDSEVTVIPYLVDMPTIDGVRVSPSHASRIGIIGTLQEGKGQTLAIPALGIVRRHVPDATLHLFGSGAPRDLLRLKRTAAEEKVVDAVIFHGFVADRSLVYGSVDVVLVASRAEAYGRVPDEAALAGVPVVFVPSGGMVERLRDGQDGIAAVSTRPEDLASAIMRALNPTDRRQGLMDSSRRALERRHRERDPHDEVDAVLRGLTVA